MIKKLIVPISSLLLMHSVSTFAQSNYGNSQSSCDYEIPLEQSLIDGDSSPVPPGSTICLVGGERGPLRVRNIEGTEENPIVIRNKDKQVLTTPYEYSLALNNVSWLRVTSTPDPDTGEYGISLGGTLGVGQLSHHIELDNLEIYRARFAGMLIKTDPNCNPATWAENFTMEGIYIHDNYIHHTEEGEGMYIGYTALKRQLECNGENTTVYPHQITDIHIYNNTLENTAADGIQIGAIQSGARIENNRIYRTGVSPFAPVWQNTGIQAGGNDILISGNHIIQSGGNGMMLDGDNIRVINNLVHSAGENGIFARNKAQQNTDISGGLPHIYQGNTVIKSADYAIKLYATDTSSAHILSNNLIETDGIIDVTGKQRTFSYLNDSVNRSEINNRHYITQ